MAAYWAEDDSTGEARFRATRVPFIRSLAGTESTGISSQADTVDGDTSTPGTSIYFPIR